MELTATRGRLDRPEITRRSIIAVSGYLLLFAVLVLLVAFRASFAKATVAYNAWTAMGSAAVAAVAIIFPKRQRWLSAPMVYLLVFCLFHLGLAPLLATGSPVPDFGNPFGTRWLLQPAVSEALYVVAVSAVCFALGARIGGIVPRSSGQVRVTSKEADREAQGRCAAVGLAAACVGVLGWVGFVVWRGGLSAIFGSYESYLALTGSGALPQLYLLITVAAALTAVAAGHPLARPAIVLLSAFVLAALPLGLRGEVLFPLAAVVLVIFKRGALRLRPVHFCLLLLLMLSLIALGRSVRATGIAEVSMSSIDVNPLHGMAELGYSLRPVGEALHWQSTIDEPAGGRTYIRPLERALSRIVPAVKVPPAEDDDLLMNVLVNERVGPIGFSPLAEGIVNFGLIGAAAYLALIGTVLGFLDRRPPTTSNLVLLSVVLVPLLVQVRNSFVAVPLQLTLGLLTWLMIVRPRRRKSDPRRPNKGPRRAGALPRDDS